MSSDTTRRRFIQTAATGAVCGVADMSIFSQLRPVSAAETKLESNIVRLDPEIEPIVRLIEETPRNKLMDAIVSRIQDGLSYREVLAALLLAGVRNVQPRPVGFKFHAVLVVNSAHLASVASPPRDRWLPIFWALDYFKSSQAEDERQGDWTMQAVDESKVPPAHKARQAFKLAMDNWDEEAADVAAAGLARSAGAAEVFEIFARYGCRDFRDIGHKAIFVANSWRTLQCIGWHHAEPVLRSLAYALLDHEGSNPAKRDGRADRPGRDNLERLKKLQPTWLSGQIDEKATTDLLTTFRTGSDVDTCEAVISQLNKGVSAQSVWDALFAGAGELVMRQPKIVALHAVTTTNALRFAFQTCANEDTRKLLLLQNAAFLPMFRDAMQGRGSLTEAPIEQLIPSDDKPDNVSDIFAEVSRNPDTAARLTLSYMKNNSRPKELIDTARVLIFLKGTNSHDYKYSSAVLEDYQLASPIWRDRYLASSMYLLRGSSDRDNGLIKRVRAAFG